MRQQDLGRMREVLLHCTQPSNLKCLSQKTKMCYTTLYRPLRHCLKMGLIRRDGRIYSTTDLGFGVLKALESSLAESANK